MLASVYTARGSPALPVASPWPGLLPADEASGPEGRQPRPPRPPPCLMRRSTAAKSEVEGGPGRPWPSLSTQAQSGGKGLEEKPTRSAGLNGARTLPGRHGAGPHGRAPSIACCRQTGCLPCASCYHGAHRMLEAATGGAVLAVLAPAGLPGGAPYTTAGAAGLPGLPQQSIRGRGASGARRHRTRPHGCMAAWHRGATD